MIQIKKDVQLKSLNTFGIEAKTRYLAIANTIEKISFALNFASYNNLPVMVLGGGSNILFTQDFDGVIIQPLIPGINVMEDTDEAITIRVGAGVNWDKLVEWTVSRGVYGLENLSLIPGSVGASPIQNIGAYGVEVKDTILKVEGINVSTKKTLELQNSECGFGYRDSIFKKEMKGTIIITYVWFKLSKKVNLITNYGNLEEEILKLGEKSLQNLRDAVINIRKRKLPDPAILGNAGSFFKNPVINISSFELIKSRYPTIPSYPLSDDQVKIPAGWLIEQCGWKGKELKTCAVHKDQALVLVNLGNAKGAEILDLARQIQGSVLTEFGIHLDFEVNIF